MIGKNFNKFKTNLAQTVSSAQSAQNYDIMKGTRFDTEGLPQAPTSAFRKRTVKLNYDENEFHMFRLPSEDGFLLNGFDRDEIFGRRKCI